MITIAHIVPQRGVNDDGKGKKFALSQLIRQVDSDYVWLHDDDVIMPQATLRQAAEMIEELAFPDMVILPLTMSEPTTIAGAENAPLKRLFIRLQQTEYALLQAITMRTAMRHKPIMCSGANLIVKRSEWLQSEAALHHEIPSGDDMFLLEDFKKRHLRICALNHPYYTAAIQPIINIRQFFHQRMRWAGKADKYQDHDIQLFGIVSTIWLIAQALNPWLSIISTAIVRAITPQPIIITFVLMLIYPYYALICLIGGLFRQQKW